MALATLFVALGAVVPAARAAAPLPPDLVPLEQQMTQLHATSERFSFQLELALQLGGSGGFLSPGKPPGSASLPLVLLFAGAGEVSEAPPAQALINAGLFGLSQQQTRLIGNTVYRDRPDAAQIDGGRPWVRSPLSKNGAQDLDPSNLLGSARGGAQGTFSKLIEMLNGAQSIAESGPVTVDDQRVTEFDATLDPATFLERLEPQAKKLTRHPLKSLFETPFPSGEKTPAKPAPPPTLKLELFIAPNGLPVRSRVTFAAEGATVAVRLDTTAINIPVHVTPPPASQTIDEAQLKRLERRQARRELAQELRTCRHLPRRVAASCRRYARRRASRGAGSEGSLF